MLSREDNLATIFWERKGSTSSYKPDAYLLYLFGMHQRFHNYVPRFDYLLGPSNYITNSLSHNFHLTWPALMHSLPSFFLKNAEYQV